MNGSRVTTVAYHVLGNPSCDKEVVWEADKQCSLCATADLDCTDTAKLFHLNFSGWDEMRPPGDDGRRWLCRACAWAYKTPLGRRHATIVDAGSGTCEFVSPGECGQRLVGWERVPPDVAIVVPLGGKRIVFPRARWGTVVTDTGPLPSWGPYLRAMTTSLIELRAIGFNEHALNEPTPPFAVMTTLTAEQRTRVRSMWRSTNQVRTTKTLYPVLIKLTRTAA